MGADIKILNKSFKGSELIGDISVKYSQLKPIKISGSIVSRLIDEFPILFIACATCKGVSEITGIEELRYKESDRIKAMEAGLKKLGITVSSTSNSITIEGGNFDGNVGSISAIEVAQTLKESKHTLNHPLIVVIFQNEEGGLFGSKVMTSGLTGLELELQSSSGYSIRKGIERIGGNIDQLEKAKLKKNEWAAYVELHIEQGGILYNENLDIGVVQGIVGIKQWEVLVTGFANHAGTTPMDQRRDALYAASQYVQAVHEIGKKTPGKQVATVGIIKSFPGAPNVIPGIVNASLEIRDLDGKKINSIYKKIESTSENIAKNTGTKFKFKQTINIIPEPTNRRVSWAINQAAQDLQLSSKFMPSGAGHDAQEMAVICPIGMIFIPSKGGISHSPKEYSSPKDIANGANVLLHTVLKLDKQYSEEN
mgnify:CR=1 FL=1